MGNANTIPVVSQVKSGVQLITGDVKGAAATQENFIHECPVVAQATSLGYALAGNEKKFVETNVRSVKTLSNVADGIPVVGHVKGTIHYLAGDKAGGDNAMRCATRTTGVLGGGAVGFLAGGPVGAVAGGIVGGAVMDTIATIVDSEIHDEFRPSGIHAAVDQVVENPNAGNVFDVVAGPVFDGVAGYGAGQITAKIQNGMTNANIKALDAQRTALSDTLTDGMGKMTFIGNAMKIGGEINQLTSKIGKLESSLGKGPTVIDPKTSIASKPTATIPKGSTAGSTASAAGTAQNEQAQEGMAEPKLKSRTESTVKQETKTEAKTECYSRTTSVETPLLEEILNHPCLKIKEKQTVFSPTDVNFMGIQDNVYLDEMITKCAAGFKHLFMTLVAEEGVQQRIYARKVRRVVHQMQKKTRTRRPSDSDSDSSSDEEEIDKIKCIHWNACGLGAQTKTDFGFVIYAAFKNPEILMFNELKVASNEYFDVVKIIAQILGYEVAYVPSSTGRPASRGSAILYKEKENFQFKSFKIDQKLAQDGRAGIEIVAADFAFQPKASKKNPSPRNENYRFICCYNWKNSVLAFNTTVELFQSLSMAPGQTTIIAGDLNFDKDEWLRRWNENGFVDTLDPNCKTNKKGTRRTAIDYVMTRKGQQSHVVSHVPLAPIGTDVHFVLPFDVAPGIGPGPCSDITCITCLAARASHVV